ncbi:MAG: hypothetical protein M3P22_02970, partial [bacterium]|nr:hypothetical protein [bacterium]
IIHRDLEIQEYTELHLPGLPTSVIAKMQAIISDPHDSTKKALLTSPVNIQELKFVQVEK